MVPHRTPFFLPLLCPSSLLWRVPTSQREIYLTFDDGPVDGPTDFVLETLEKFGAKATFFCIGDNVQKHEGVYRKILDGNHTVGNHTFNHLNGWKTERGEYRMNIELCDEQMKASGGTRSYLFRPPYGRITRAQIHDLEKYKIVMWDVLSVDYDKLLSAERCLKNSIAATRPGSIVVFHDSFKAERNMMFALPRFLEHFNENGYKFRSLA
jgi:peptidoglycan-N-acetylglucosamine deacetylase